MCKRVRYGLPSGHSPCTRGAYDFDRLSSVLSVDHVCPGPLRVRPCAQMSPHEAVPLSKAESLPQKTKNPTKTRPCSAQNTQALRRAMLSHTLWAVRHRPRAAPALAGVTATNAMRRNDVKRGATRCGTL